MIELLKEIGMYVYRFVTHRILWLFIVTVMLFGIMLVQLFELQIVIAHTFVTPPAPTHHVEIPTPPLRGTIYDRHGRPLAQNTPVFVVKMDPSVQITNQALLELARLFERNGEDYVNSFPISLDPLEFNEAIVTNANQEFRWKDDMQIPNARYATAAESFEYLRQSRLFGIDPELSDEDAVRILNFRCKIFRERMIFIDDYNPTPILFAVDVSQETIAEIAERNTLFTGIFIDIQTQREYPGGRYVSHIIGYIGGITAEDYAANAHLGYTHNDQFGRLGLERSMEHYLRGTPGLQSMEITRGGVRIGEPTIMQEALPGDRIFLTIDLDLQIQGYYMLKSYLTETLVRRLTVQHQRERMLTLQEVFISFVESHNLDVRTVLAAEDGHALPMQRYILQRFPHPTNSREDMEEINGIIIDGIRANRISPAMMLLTLIGTEQITDPDGTVSAQLLSPRQNTARDILVEKIRAWEITPQQVNQDPSTASMVILDSQTGAVLAAVSYPSFDNNRLVNTMDVAYFNHVNFLDRTLPAVPRAFREPLAPGSNFKMITAVAGLEDGVLTQTRRITDRVAFTRAGSPALNCWLGRGHGTIDVRRAIAVSCNYFFAQTSWELGPGEGNRTLERIDTLNTWMKYFGLHQRSGVELLELFDMAGYEGYRIASPGFMRHQILQGNPNARPADYRWTDAQTIRAAIGQSFHTYTTAQMARAMNVFANHGTNYPLHLVSHIDNSQGHTVRRTVPEPFCMGIETSPTTWQAVADGMLMTTQTGRGGTADALFRGFPISVAGKTSTTQQIQGRFNHTAFGAFAPAEDPQITIYVNVPFSASVRHNQLAARITKSMIGVALGLELEAEHALPLNALRP